MDSDRGVLQAQQGPPGFEVPSAGAVAWTVAVLVGIFVGSVLLVAVWLARMPATYFPHDQPRPGWGDRHPALRWAVLVVKKLWGPCSSAWGS